jgi:hypothetical protein
MTARRSAKINPAGDTPRRVADALAILDDNTLVEFTPTNAADATAPAIKFAHDSSYMYVQLETGVWKRAALATW